MVLLSLNSKESVLPGFISVVDPDESVPIHMLDEAHTD